MTPGLFRIKAGTHELPFQMENGLATLKLRVPTDEELESCDVVQLTSDAPWNPACLNGVNFPPGADVYAQQKTVANQTAYGQHQGSKSRL